VRDPAVLYRPVNPRLKAQEHPRIRLRLRNGAHVGGVRINQLFDRRIVPLAGARHEELVGLSILEHLQIRPETRPRHHLHGGVGHAYFLPPLVGFFTMPPFL
jgi:hypothetical protein